MPYMDGYHYPYNFAMGITVGNGNTPNIPDPSEWTYQVGDLDTSGARDATGLLHRAYVASKINYEFKWNAIEWKMLQNILALVNTPKFRMTAPDPRTFDTMYTGDYYVGDRTGSVKYYLPSDPDTGRTGKPEIAVYDLKLKFIEY